MSRLFFVVVKLGPNVTVGKGVQIGAGVRVRESIILEGAIIQVSSLYSDMHTLMQSL